MAEITERRCDVSGKANAARMNIIVDYVDGETNALPPFTRMLDLCPRSLDRLVAAINRALTPSKKRARKA